MFFECNEPHAVAGITFTLRSEHNGRVRRTDLGSVIFTFQRLLCFVPGVVSNRFPMK